MDSEFDLVVIGGGSAGYAAAVAGVRAGLKTALAEGAERIGGLCILRGCMPTKALLYAAEVLHLTRHAGAWGMHPGNVTFDFLEVMRRKDLLIDDFAAYRRQQLSSGDFRFIHSRAAFIDEHTIVLDSGERIRGKHFVICTGSRVSDPPVAALRKTSYLTSDDALELERPPQSLIVLGGGAVAVEFAQFFVRFGVKVTLIQRSTHILSEFDVDAADALETVFRREGIDLFTGTRLIDFAEGPSGKRVVFEKDGRSHEVTAEALLFALGRSPNLASLGLDLAGVRVDGPRIWTDARMQTSVPHIYAAGDCTGRHEIVHLAIQQAEIAVHNIALPDKPRDFDERLLLIVVFTDPQIAQLGLTEKAARAQGRPFSVASYRFADHGKALIMEAKDGFVKLLAEPVSGEIIGATCVGPLGGELIHEIMAAMAKRMTVHELAAMPHYHPTLAEIWAYPAEDLAAKLSRTPVV